MYIRGKMNIFLRILLYIGIFYLMFGAMLFFLQDKVIYQPDMRVFEDCNLPWNTLVQRLDSGGFYHINPDAKRLVLMYHGNAGRACDRVPLYDFLESFDVGFLLVEYPLYSGLDGRLSQLGIEELVVLLADYLGEEYEILILGESLGTYPALYHANNFPNAVYGVFLLSSFTSLRDVSSEKFWFYPSVLVRDDFDVLSLAGEVSKKEINGYVFHGADDEIVGVWMGESVSDAGNFEFIEVEGGHNDVLLSNRFWEKFIGLVVR